MTYNEVCWKIVKTLLDEFPSLRERAKEYPEDQVQFRFKPTKTIGDNGKNALSLQVCCVREADFGRP